MKADELRQKYLDYFQSMGHVAIASAPLIPEHDPTVLFTTAGMQPLVAFFLDNKHPLGERITNFQKCIRTGDIDEVGDTTHHTFFEMMGYWSLGDYFKKEAIEMTFEFLTAVLKLPLSHLAFTCFSGDENAPKDEDAAQAWLDLGVPEERIAFLGKDDNWWGPAGESGPCGPSTEIYYWSSVEEPPQQFDPEDGRWVEIGNDVLIEYEKTKEGKFKPLKKKSIDFGGGFERTLAVMNGLNDNYMTELFLPLIKKIEKITKQKYVGNEKSFRVIADHVKASVFILGDERGAVPSNVDQGYILRRFIRRAIRHLRSLGVAIEKIDLTPFVKIVVDIYGEDYTLLLEKKEFIVEELKKEQEQFKRTLEKGLNQFKKMSSGKKIDGKDAFLLFQSYGFPIEMTEELAAEKKITVDKVGFNVEYEKHQELSRVGAEKKFKGGLSDASEETTKLHTATHLLNEALRRVLKENIAQRGSNITAERLRFDFNFERKLTAEELAAIEKEVNDVIAAGMEVIKEEMELKKALKSGAHGEFGTKYPEKVSVYSVGDYSKEICMGPHVGNTSVLGAFKIKKESSSSAGVRRIKAILE
ncbi:alanine--tRNA ligase [Candidatus Woesearchaeota archaeon]|nr:alanine--tRNA ligase [Candidatus Woesearchaeota archaeon]